MDSKQLKGVYQLKQDTYDQMVNEGTTDSSLYFVRDFDGNGKPTSSSIYLGDRKYGEMCNDTIEGNDVEGYDGYSRYVIIEDLKEITESSRPFIITKKLNGNNVAIFTGKDFKLETFDGPYIYSTPLLYKLQDDLSIICEDSLSYHILNEGIRNNDSKYLCMHSYWDHNHKDYYPDLEFVDDYYNLRITEYNNQFCLTSDIGMCCTYLYFSNKHNRFHCGLLPSGISNNKQHTLEIYVKQDI